MEKRSLIWKYFEVCGTDESKATCKLCKNVISRGGSAAKNYTTSPLNNHLSYRHPDDYQHVIKQRSLAQVSTSGPCSSGATSTQVTLEQLARKRKAWDIDSAEAPRVHEAIGRMIALDVQPYAVVENRGFKRLVEVLEPRYVMPSRKFFSEKVIPEMYDSARANVQTAIDEAKSVCLTTDTWTSTHTTESFMSLTAHWISDDFGRKYAVLHCEKFDGQPTGVRLAGALNDMLHAWNIEKAKVHAVLRDNAANIVKGLRDAEVVSVSCFAHTLQLSIHDAILCQQSVADLISAARKVVGHFKHSSNATSRLHAIQTDLSLPQHQLCQDVVTRWNSTFAMLERLAEQKRAVCVYVAETDDITSLSNYQWTLLCRTVTI
jgi:hypothetical protein